MAKNDLKINYKRYRYLRMCAARYEICTKEYQKYLDDNPDKKRANEIACHNQEHLRTYYKWQKMSEAGTLFNETPTVEELPDEEEEHEMWRSFARRDLEEYFGDSYSVPTVKRKHHGGKTYKVYEYNSPDPPGYQESEYIANDYIDLGSEYAWEA